MYGAGLGGAYLPAIGWGAAWFSWARAVKAAWFPGGSEVVASSPLSHGGRLFSLRIHAMPTHAVRLHRVLRAAPDMVYRAFVEPEALAK